MKSVMEHQFSIALQDPVPRSHFNRSHGHKTTFNAGLLVPIYCDEVIPGDTFNMNCGAFLRLLSPLEFPIMDNMFCDVHFFFQPYRQIWDNFRRFMGEEINPGDGIDFVVPVMEGLDDLTLTSGTTGDYLGLPLIGLANAAGLSGNVSALPFRAYNKIYNEWYRDENLIDSLTVDLDDGPDDYAAYRTLRRRGKRHDYFTSCLPWPQKFTAPTFSLAGAAPVEAEVFGTSIPGLLDGDGGNTQLFGNVGSNVSITTTPSIGASLLWSADTGLVADLSAVTVFTINQLREAAAIQQLLENDARGGTRYAELVKQHWNVNFYDVSYRPEYLGGGSFPINVHPVPNTTNLAGEAPQAQLAAFATAHTSGAGFTKSFVEHGLIMGIASVRADLTYQQGLPRMFSRSTRYDYPWPELMHIGEQPVLNKELFTIGGAADLDPADNDVFGYQEPYADFRYHPSKITGLFRSDVADSLDVWHLSQDFAVQPVLGQTFIEETPPIDRVVAVNTVPHFIADFYFNLQCARAMPVFSVPGLKKL